MCLKVSRAIPCFLAVLAILPSGVIADEVSCDAVKTISKVGINDRNRVSVTADRNSLVCRFSIDGAPLGSPPPEMVTAAFDAIKTKAMRGLLENKKVDFLAFALLAASPDRTIPDELRSTLVETSADIAKCFAAFDASIRAYDGFTGKRAMCQVVAPDTTARPRLQEKPTVQFLRSGASILVGASVGAVEHYISVPESQ